MKMNIPGIKYIQHIFNEKHYLYRQVWTLSTQKLDGECPESCSEHAFYYCDMPCNGKCYYRYCYEGTGRIKGKIYTKHRVQPKHFHRILQNSVKHRVQPKHFHRILQNSVGIKPKQIVLC